MKTYIHPVRWGCAVLTALALILTPLRAADATVPINIKCSPSVVILNAIATGDCLTVHTDLPLRDVDKTFPVELNGLAAYLIKADNRGYLVAKFDLTALRSLLTPPATTLTLAGLTVTGSVFIGSDVVRVVK